MHPFKTILVLSAFALLPSMAMAADASSSALTDAQKTAVEAVVRELLLKKEPELIVKAAQEVQKRMETESAAKGQEAILKNRDKLLKDPNAPVGGNPKGDVTVVEFFDYQCGYCKMAQENVLKLLNDDKNVRILYKEYPILGPVSTFAAKAALASVEQGKYIKFHEALMSVKDRLTEESVLSTAKSVGLDVEKLKKTMESEKIEKIIKDNQDLAAEIGARGTPAFIIGDKLYPGVLSVEQMKETIAEARKSAKK